MKQTDSEQKRKIAIYKTILKQWNKTHKLTSDISDKTIDKNIKDSIHPLKFIKTPKTVADIGSGAGYPALPLAVMLEECSFTLFEPLGKKASFLLNASIEMGLSNVKVEQSRVEEYSGEKFELITSRAVGDVDTILSLSEHIVDEKSRFLLYTGEDKASKFVSRKNTQTHRYGSRVYIYF